MARRLTVVHFAAAAAVLAALAATAGLVAFLLLRDGGGSGLPAGTSANDSLELLLADGEPQPYQLCGNDPNWVQPPFLDVIANPFFEEDFVTSEDALTVYERRIYMHGPGESVNRFWNVMSGSNRNPAIREGPDCPQLSPSDVYPVGEKAVFTLIYYQPAGVRRVNDALVIQLEARERGIVSLEIDLASPAPELLVSYFVNKDDELILICRTAGCDQSSATAAAELTPTLVPATPTPAPSPTPRRTSIAEVDAVLDAIFSGDAEAVAALIGYTTIPCVTEVTGLGGPPLCLPGEPDGTLVEVFSKAQCEGYYVRPDRMAGTLSHLSSLDKELYGVYRSPPLEWPGGDYVVIVSAVVTPEEGEPWVSGSGIFIEDDRIVAVYSGCAQTPDQVVENWKLTDVVLQPLSSPNGLLP